MQNALNPLVNMYQTQLEASRRFADAVFSGTEKIDRVFIGATHRAFTEQMNFAQAIATARDPRTMGTTLQSGFMSRSPDDAMSYQKEIMRVFAEVQNDIGRSLQEYIEQLGTRAAQSATAPLEAVQGRTNDAVFNPMTSMFSVWESAFKEVADLAKKNMMAARSTATEAANKVMQTAGSYANAAAGTAQNTLGAADSVANAATHAARNAMHASEDGSDEKRGSSTTGGKRK
jgi:ElaB/YqjD/DUF883 family membrane-anchored ribosome-binding protein